MTDIAHTNLHGYPDSGFDRPVAMQEELSQQAEIEQLRAQLDETNRLYNQYVAQPLLSEQQARQRDSVRSALQTHYGLADVEGDAGMDRFINDFQVQQQYTKALEEKRVNDSFERAAQEFGPEFHKALGDMTAMDPRSQLARELVSAVYNSVDPKDAVMRLHGDAAPHATAVYASCSALPPPHATLASRWPAKP
jgi:hypothetical protein